ncbi:MAG: phosphoenolpyruvate carboxylase [Desulfobulbaceae bacterium]|nr:MAG: phosphoenolpyruvate carboxylase [Desulfobulbaceae bacterium]
MAGPFMLVQEIRKLTENLHQVLQEQEGSTLTELVEHILDLAKARRRGDEHAAEELAEIIAQLDTKCTAVVLRAINLLFDLINIAEDRHRIRMLRDRERRSGRRPRPQSIGVALAHLNAEGYSAQQIQGFLDKLSIEPVFTAHPTEAKRRTVRGKLKRIQASLARHDQLNLLPREIRNLEEAIHSEMVALWQTDPQRPQRPTVLEEVERALFFMKTLWDVVPRLNQDLDDGLAHYFPGNPFTGPRFLHFGSWIGGDRDGNPYVTSEVTAQTLTMLRQAALDAQLKECREMYQRLSMSSRRIEISDELRQALVATLEQWPQVGERLESIPRSEIYRRWLRAIEWRLQQARVATPFAEPPDGAYHRSAELENDVTLILNSLRAHGAEVVAETTVKEWLSRIRVFGFHMTRLDIRQDSGDYEQVVAELLARQNLCVDYLSMEEEKRQEVLSRTMGMQEPLATSSLSEEAQETLALFRLLTRTAHLYGAEVLGGHVISMTHQPSHVLMVLWLLRWAAREAGDDNLLGLGRAGIIPLFETIDDLQRSGGIMAALLANDLYSKHLSAWGNAQTVMVGYSDSTKDGGYLAASWALYHGQSQLHEICESHGIELIVFHGRGGSLGRGGGPAARSIMSLPPHTVGGAIRMTEQGEVLAERYDSPEIAFRHLEQITAATFLVEAESAEPPQETWLLAMEKLAERSYRVYRELVEQPDFVEYFRTTTPIDEIENLPIGSRPSRRRQNVHTLETLRAIPWVFAWTQCRVMIPAWYGMGSALHELAAAEGWSELRRMYKEWAFFRGTVDNAELALAKASLDIAEAYARLMENEEQRRAIWQPLADEYSRTSEAIRRLTDETHLVAATPWLRRAIDERNPYVDPLNFIQVELIKRARAALEEQEEIPEDLRTLLRLSIQGISSALRTTG